MHSARLGSRFATLSIGAALTLCSTVTFAQTPTVLMASPLIREEYTYPSNLTCYLSNVGDKPVSVKKLEFYTSEGTLKKVDANTCGALSGFTLAPNGICYIGDISHIPHAAMVGVGCRASVSDAESIRGSIELRYGIDNSFSTLSSIELSPGTGSKDAKYQSLASPPSFAKPNQRSAECRISNLGKTPVKVKDVRIVRSNGPALPLNLTRCPQTNGVATLAPGKSCEVTAEPVTITDLQCRASVTRKANVRGALTIYDSSYIEANTKAMN